MRHPNFLNFVVGFGFIRDATSTGDNLDKEYIAEKQYSLALGYPFSIGRILVIGTRNVSIDDMVSKARLERGKLMPNMKPQYS